MQRSLASTAAAQLRRAALPAQRTHVIASRESHVITALPSRFLSSSSRLASSAFPTPPPEPTGSEESVAADRGDLEKTTTTTIQQKTKTVIHNVHPEQAEDPQHPGKSEIDHLDNPSLAEETVHADRGAADPLQGRAKRGYHTSAVARSAADPREGDGTTVQHPGRSDIEHLDNPSMSEEFVHADREDVDPLKGNARKVGGGGGAASTTTAAAGGGIAGAATKVVDAMKDAVGATTGKKSFSTSARARLAAAKQDSDADDEGVSAQHPGKSGHSHLDNPSLSEENVHADMHAHDPLEGTGRKASERKGVKAGVANSKSQQSTTDEPDAESTRRSMEDVSRRRLLGHCSSPLVGP
ncbi:hypothetical protein JCM21900_004561 [Sporobolomyces salmonicolor]